MAVTVRKYLDLTGLQTYNTQLMSTYLSVVNRANDGTEQDPVYRYDTKASTLNGVIPTDNVTMSAGPSNDLSIATKKYVDDSVKDITSAMVFKGGITATTADSTTTLTLADIHLGKINKGYTFKFTANETGGTTFKLGDILIANNDITHTAGTTVTYDSNEWTLVPSGEDVDVTSVGVSGVGLGTSVAGDGDITSTGTINLKLDSQTALTGDTICNLGVNSSGNLAVKVPTAGSTLGLVKDGDRITIANDGSISADIATSSAAGAVSPDGTVITVDVNGNITVPAATTGAFGVVKTGTNITNTNGVISVATADDSTLGVVKPDNTTIVNGTTGETPVTTGVISVKYDGESILSGNSGLYVDTITYGNNSDISALFG